ncbi:hypothetical protein [Acrocarpospora catenulata]|uniref:hypothetical protein n=1 Tax=Acrocarpospora catenulata TaxID=2836182 RepID=UPI001BD9CF3F|nr:hypothetical protein [Acrocarpospora catenulata]
MDALQRKAIEIIAAERARLSDFHMRIFDYAEPAWREYRSAEAYVNLLRTEGFHVEESSAGMPTAFCATWENGRGGPTVGMYAEYDATPGYSQDPVPYRSPRAGLHKWAPGFTDSHHTLGVGSLTGVLAAKRALEGTNVPVRLKFFGEPAEKMCGSKVTHAAHGYYDDLDAAISYHPYWHNTALWDTLGCYYWSVMLTFECEDEDPWGDFAVDAAMGSHNRVRSPGATDALAMMLMNTKVVKENMFPRIGLWSLNEAIVGSNFATADNLPARIGQIQYSWRSPSHEVQETILHTLLRTAAGVANMSNTRLSMRWLSKVRPGLPNHALTQATFDNLAEFGAPVFEESVYRHAAALESELGFTPGEDPFMPQNTTVTPLEVTEANMRFNLPQWQTHSGADDYTEYTWHCPTARFFTSRPFLRQLGGSYWHWANNTFNGLRAAIDPTWVRAGEVIATTVIRYVQDDALREAARTEFEERRATSEERLLRPAFDGDFAPPHDLPWPEYVTTKRGHEWVLPHTDNFGELLTRPGA